MLLHHQAALDGRSPAKPAGPTAGDDDDGDIGSLRAGWCPVRPPGDPWLTLRLPEMLRLGPPRSVTADDRLDFQAHAGPAVMIDRPPAPAALKSGHHATGRAPCKQAGETYCLWLVTWPLDEFRRRAAPDPPSGLRAMSRIIRGICRA